MARGGESEYSFRGIGQCPHRRQAARRRAVWIAHGPGEEEWTLIFSKNADAWGSFFYDEAEDALRVTVKPHKHDYREYLTYEFPHAGRLRQPPSCSGKNSPCRGPSRWKMPTTYTWRGCAGN